MKVKKNKSVAIIFAGGSLITTSHNKSVVSVDSIDQMHRWLEELPELTLLADLKPFFVSGDSEPFSIESIELTAKILEKEEYNFEGFILLFNAKDISLAGSALEFMLKGFSKPIVLSGSRFYENEIRPDSIRKLVKSGLLGLRSNLINALQLIASSSVGIPAIVFGSRIIQPTHAIIDNEEGLNFFRSIDSEYIGRVDFGITISNPKPFSDTKRYSLELGRNLTLIDSRSLLLSNSSDRFNNDSYAILKLYSEKDIGHSLVSKNLSHYKTTIIHGGKFKSETVYSLSNITWDALVGKALWASKEANSSKNFIKLMMTDQVGEMLES